jgi:multidrug efflux pump subunit AcrB
MSIRRSSAITSWPRSAKSKAMVQIDLLTNTDLRTVEEFENLIVWQSPASAIRPDHSTVGRRKVELGSEEPTATAMYRGENAIYVSVWPLPGSNEIEVSTGTARRDGRVATRFAPHVDMEFAYDGTKFMRKSLVRNFQNADGNDSDRRRSSFSCSWDRCEPRWSRWSLCRYRWSVPRW